MRYPYAVMDERQPEDVRQAPVSVHRSRKAAIRAAERETRRDPNNAFRAVQWGAERWAREYHPCLLDA